MEVDIKIRPEIKAKTFLEFDKTVSEKIDGKTPAQIMTWLQNNVTTLQDAYKVLAYLILKVQVK